MQPAKPRLDGFATEFSMVFSKRIFHRVYMTSPTCWSLVLWYQSTQVAKVLAEVKEADKSSHADVTSV